MLSNSNSGLGDSKSQKDIKESKNQNNKQTNISKLVPIKIKRKPYLFTKTLPDYTDNFKSRLEMMIEELFYIVEINESGMNDTLNSFAESDINSKFVNTIERNVRNSQETDDST